MMTTEDRLQQFIKNLRFPEAPGSKNVENDLDDLSPDQIIPALIEVLHSNDSMEIKKSAINVLGYLKDTTTLKPLLDIIMNEDVELQKVAIKAVGILNYQGAIPALEKTLNRSSHPDIIQLCSQVIQILQGIAPQYSVEEL